MDKIAVYLAVLLAVTFNQNALAQRVEGDNGQVQTAEVTSANEESAANTESSQAESEIGYINEEAEYLQQMQAFLDSLNKQHGKIDLLNGAVTLEVPENFYFLDAEGARKVLVEAWGNPPMAADGVLGMIFPENMTPLDDDSWGATISYQADGYVSDEDANKIDYAEMLVEMKKEMVLESKERETQGYGSIELIGWAAEPFYNQQKHQLYWAKELKFDGEELNTLNYDIRVLGRKGVLVIGFIATMDQKDMIDTQLDPVLAMAHFNEGSRYQDFDSSIDKVAAYGIGALVAGKVAAKTGLLAAALIFLKKFGVIIAIAVAAFFGKLFRRKPKE